MSIERDKFLTEVMGECWHEMSKFGNCAKCKVHNYYQNDFSTWKGFGKLWEWATTQAWWELFTEFCEYNRQFHQKSSHQVLPGIINPNRFADAVYKYLKENGE